MPHSYNPDPEYRMETSVFQAMLHVFVVLMAITIPVAFGIFDSVHTDITLDHYAEKPWPVLSKLLPWIPMPANTIVNVTYACSGIYWIMAMNILVKSQKRTDSKSSAYVTNHDAYMMYVMGWIGVLYAPVQLSRLLLLKHRLAVLDQWYTLPGFAWALVWSRYLLNGWSPFTMVSITIVSTMTYFLSLVTTIGFDVALASHIVVVVRSCWEAQKIYGNSASRAAYFKAIMSCAGFVFLKLGDTYFPAIHPIFNYLSGHFWSKICDAVQIYFVAEFFFILTIEKRKKIGT